MTRDGGQGEYPGRRPVLFVPSWSLVSLPAEHLVDRPLAGEPVIVLQRRTFTADGRVVEFARGVHAASHFSWSYTFKIPD
jgi:hypothetical protein